MNNEILEDHRRWVLLDISTPKHPEAKMKIDKVDLVHLIEIGCGKIYAMEGGGGNNNIYAITKINGKNNKVHRLLLPDSKMVDHINRDSLDNRQSNIRPSNPSQNSINSKIRCTNTSGAKGVWWYKTRCKWVAKITRNGVLRHLGYFDDKQDAIDARKEAEEAHLAKGF